MGPIKAGIWLYVCPPSYFAQTFLDRIQGLPFSFEKPCSSRELGNSLVNQRLLLYNLQLNVSAFLHSSDPVRQVPKPHFKGIGNCFTGKGTFMFLRAFSLSVSASLTWSRKSYRSPEIFSGPDYAHPLIGTQQHLIVSAEPGEPSNVLEFQDTLIKSGIERYDQPLASERERKEERDREKEREKERREREIVRERETESARSGVVVTNLCYLGGLSSTTSISENIQPAVITVQ
ncbi:hypothetical protein J6590_059812 [Homalodisca vitripennis]|nr:hypothetical protein J6590_059812 [Homalodisca vitripennis]